MSNWDQQGTDATVVEGAAFEDGDRRPSEVALQLRAARERAGYELIDVAAALRIRHAHLLAIEDGRMTDLPGPAYAVGFLRSYAEFLGLDGEAVVRLFKDEVRGFGASGKLVFPAPVEEGKRPTAALVVLSLLVAVGVYGIWHYLSLNDRTVLESVSELPERLLSKAEEAPPSAVVAVDVPGAQDGDLASAPRQAQGPGDEPVSENASAAPRAAPLAAVAAAEVAGATAISATAAEDIAATASSGTERDADATPVATPVAEAPVAVPAEVDAAPASLAALADIPSPPPEFVVEALPPPPVLAQEPSLASPAPPKQVVAAAPVPEPPALPATSTSGSGAYVPQVYGAGNTEARVVLRAESDSWVQIHGANNELVLTRMLRAGDRYRVPDRDDLLMVTGNAGAIEITVDGKAIPPVGPLGAVRRNISLDADRLLALAAERQ
ncbi:MAG: DUF4115 domain-containing protein [Alphaproteobacteria bacterium]|nr:DUF4115 domain-containing protein [Alphaproteobacteria bacterium]